MTLRQATSGAVAASVVSSPTLLWAAEATTASNPLSVVALLALLALLPFLLIMVTSFAKIAVVLSLLRSAIGVQQVPPNQVITGLAIILSAYVMAPVGTQIYRVVEPHVAEVESETFDHSFANYLEVGDRAIEPLRRFLLEHSDPDERELLYDLALELREGEPEDDSSLSAESLIVTIPAFVLTELEEAFTIGFLLFVPFIIVDLVVANILLSLGMHMLSPTTISLPFKLLLFVLVDGWYLVVRGLILGYA